MPAETPVPEPNSTSPFLSTAPAVDVLARIGQGLGVRKPLLVLTGESGMGKSPLAREALRRLGKRATIAWMAEPHLDAKELVGTLLTLFGGTARPGTSPLAYTERLLTALGNATAGGRVAVLVVDDAHALADDVLLELGRIADRAAQRLCPLEILLVGQPALAARLAEPVLASVREQVSLSFELPALNAHHTRRYLLLLPAPPDAERPPQFSRKACRDIHTASRGVPRDIETIAAESTRRAARANATTVSPEHVRAAVQAMKSRGPAAKPSAPAARPTPGAVAAASAGAAASAPQAVAKPATREATQEPARPSRAQQAKDANEKGAASKAAPVAQASARANGESGTAASDSSSEPAPSSEFEPSNDPRVKDWVSRFGGSGVRLGGFYTGPVSDEPADEPADEPIDEPVAEPIEATTKSHRVPAAPAARTSHDAPAPLPERGAKRELVAVVVDPSAEPVNWPPRGAPVARTGPVLGKGSGSSLGWAVVALVLAVALGAVMLAQRRMLANGEEPVASSVELTPQVETQGSQQTDTVDAPLADTQPPAPKPKRAKTTTTAARTERSERVTRAARRAVADAPPAGVRYTVIVGSFLERDMAWAEREHLSRLTSYPVWVSRRSIDGVRTYRIILGAFESVEVAEVTAQALLQRGLLRDARVVALPLDP